MSRLEYDELATGDDLDPAWFATFFDAAEAATSDLGPENMEPGATPASAFPTGPVVQPAAPGVVSGVSVETWGTSWAPLPGGHACSVSAGTLHARSVMLVRATLDLVPTAVQDAVPADVVARIRISSSTLGADDHSEAWIGSTFPAGAGLIAEALFDNDTDVDVAAGTIEIQGKASSSSSIRAGNIRLEILEFKGV